MEIWFILVLALVVVQRIGELWHARRTAQRLERRGAQWVPADGYGLLFVVHVLLIAGALAEAIFAPWADVGWWTVAGALLFGVGAALRYASMLALGDRWSTRVYILDEPLVKAGPYRWLRHPIYVGVTLELAGIPMMAGLWVTLVVVAALNALALARRIRVEERALGIR
jgi:methyltransferase